MRFFGALAVFYLSFVQVSMAEPQKQEVQFRLRDAGVDSQSRYALLNVSSPDNIKTYWKYAGFGGISPVIDLSKSQNLKSFKLYWNLPKIFQTDGFNNYVLGHKDKILIKATPENVALPVALVANIDYGYCDTQCKFASVSKKVSLNSDSTLDKSLVDFMSLVTDEPKGKAPFELSKFSAVKSEKNYIISFYVKDMPLLSEDNFFYWFDKEHKIIAPMIQKMSQDTYFVTLELGESLVPPKQIEMIFPVEKGKNILYKRDLKFKESQEPI